MEKQKIIPIFIAAILLFAAIVLFKISKTNNQTYSELIIAYNGEETKIDKIVAGSIYHINDITFEVVSAGGNKIILLSSEDLIDNNNVSNEITIKLKETKEICVSYGDCYTLDLR